MNEAENRFPVPGTNEWWCGWKRGTNYYILIIMLTLLFMYKRSTCFYFKKKGPKTSLLDQKLNFISLLFLLLKYFLRTKRGGKICMYTYVFMLVKICWISYWCRRKIRCVNVFRCAEMGIPDH